MMYAEREKVISGTMVDMVSIRFREVELLSKQAAGLGFLFGIISGVLCDSMYTGYYMYYIRLITPSRLVEGVSALSMYISIFLPLLGLWRCMLLMALAPFKALRGRPADLAAAVDAYREELVRMSWTLILTVASIFTTLITFLLASQLPDRFALLAAGTEAIGSSGMPAFVAGTAATCVCASAVYQVAWLTYNNFRVARPVHGEYWSTPTETDARSHEAAALAAELSVARRKGFGDDVSDGRDDERPMALQLAALFDRDQSKELF